MAAKRGSKQSAGKTVLTDLDLTDLDQVMRVGYQKVKEALADKEAELKALEAERDELMARAAGLEAYLGLTSAPEAPAKPAPRKPAAPTTRAAGKAKGKGKGKRKGGRKPGTLWNDVVAAMKGKGALRASAVIELLIERGYTDDERTRTRVYNSLGRWAREGKLKKSGRGRYAAK